MADLGLPKNKKDIVDLSMFDRKTIADIDVDVILKMSDETNINSILEDQIVPIIKRRVKDSSMEDVVKTIYKMQKELHKKYDDVLEYSAKAIFDGIVDEEMSIQSIKEYSEKQLESDAEDYWLFDEFLEDDREVVDTKLTMEQRFRNRYNALSEFMFTWDMRIFKVNGSEDKKEIICRAYNEVFWKYMEKKDFNMLAGLGDAEWFIIKNIGRRSVSDETLKMMECMRALNNRKYSKYTVQEIKNN